MDKLRKQAAILNFQERVLKTFLDFFLWPTYLLNEEHFIWKLLSHNQNYNYFQRFIVSLIASTIWYTTLSVMFFNIFNGINNFLNSKNEIRKLKEEEQFYQRKHPFSLNGLTRSTKDTLYSRGGFLNSMNFYLPNYINFEGQLIDVNTLELDPIFLYIRMHKLINCIYLKDGLGLEPFFHYKIPLSDGTMVKISSKVTNFSRRFTRRIVNIMKSEYTFFIFGTLILGLVIEYFNLIPTRKTPTQVHQETELIRSAKAPIELVQKSAVEKSVIQDRSSDKSTNNTLQKSEEVKKEFKSKEIKKRKFNTKIHRLSDLPQEQNQIEEYQEFESTEPLKSNQRKIVPKIRID